MSKISKQLSNTVDLSQMSPLKVALAAQRMRPKLSIVSMEPIAVIGMGCRFPGGANNPDAFWQLLRDGVDAIGDVPPSRWDVDAYYDPDPDAVGKIYIRQGGFIDLLRDFDADFFNIAPREMKSIDPQQRLLLEVTWEALESAALAPDKLKGSKTGVFVGLEKFDYFQRLLERAPEEMDAYMVSGNIHSAAAGRLSYLLDLQGPAVAIDTACSSSLVALHLAVMSLRQGESDLALAGGANQILSPEFTVGISKARMLSPDGRCKTLDAAADGMARAEGCGVVVLKRLSDAITAKDNILALIRGSAINQDGRTSGLTVPNGLAQQKVIRQALQNAGLNPSQISYVEAHGTGTSLGDPIEVEALGQVFAEGRPHDQPLLIGSVKTNIGHAEVAAGMASLIKVILSLQHEEIPPHLHFHQPNPYIDWQNLPVEVTRERTPWPSRNKSNQSRFAGVSGFGMSGTNAHLIIEEAPATRGRGGASRDNSLRGHTQKARCLLTLSAKSDAALNALTARYERHLASHPKQTLADICFTANTGRSHFSHRLAIVATSSQQMLQKLAAYKEGESKQGVTQGYAPSYQEVPKLAFLFTGQGSQYVGMGRELYETQPTFRQTLEQCDEYLRQFDVPLLSVLYPVGQESRIHQTAYTQPALFALEYALAQLWRSWGVKPDVVMGHSVGEYVAACLAGVFSLEDALKLIAARGRLMGVLPHDGAMVSVMANYRLVQQAIAPVANEVSIAAINDPESVVISGKREAVMGIAEQLEDEGVKTRHLTVSHAFHSSLMEPMLDEFRQVAASITYHKPKLPLVSNVTGKLVSTQIATPEYWVRHVRETVRFADGVRTLHKQDINIFLEIGPKATLLGMARGTKVNFGDASEKEYPAAYLPSLRENRNDWQQMLTTLGELYIRGVSVDWEGFHKAHQRRKVVLPTYPFQRKRYWVESRPHVRPEVERAQKQVAYLTPLIDKLIQLPRQKEIVCETNFSVARLPFLADHLVFGEMVSPGACQLAMVLEAAHLAYPQEALQLVDVVLPQALVLANDKEKRTVQVVFSSESPSAATTFELVSFQAKQAEATLQIHASGKLAPTTPQPPVVDIALLRTRCRMAVDLERFDALAAAQKIQFGPTFRWLAEVWCGQGEAIGRLLLPEAVDKFGEYLLHPALLDTCLQVITTIKWSVKEVSENNETYLPFVFESVTLFGQIKGGQWWCHAQLVDSPKHALTKEGSILARQRGQFQLLDNKGTVLAQIEGYTTRKASRQLVLGTEAWRDWLYQVEWQPRPYFGLLPDYLPAPATIAPALLSSAPTLFREHDGDKHQNLITALEELSLEYVLAAFTKASAEAGSLGFSFQTGTQWRSSQIAQQIGVIPSYQRLFTRLLAMLAEVGILTQTKEAWRVVKEPEAVNPVASMRMVQTQFGNPPELTLLARCGEKLLDVLRGVQEPLELLFPGRDTSLVSQLYTSPSAQVMNDLVQQVVKNVLHALPKENGINVIEIGAGTGGTTASVLPLLPAAQTDYLFTDIGPAFLRQARTRFADYSFVRYQPLDIEQSPTEQGFRHHAAVASDAGVASHQADLIIAANVLHATKNLTETLANVRQLLQPGGLLVLVEATSRRRWVDLTFGLTDGWWRFADDREDYPLLTAEQWKTVLLENGFQAVESIEEGGQAVIIAQADTNNELAEVQVAEAAKVWLIFADAQCMGKALATQLQQRGEMPILIYAGQRYQQIDACTITIRPDSASDYQRLLASIGSVHAIVHLWSLDIPYLKDGIEPSIAKHPGGTSLVDASRQGCGTVLQLVQALLSEQIKPAALCLVTFDAQAVTERDATGGVIQSALWGMGKVIALEHPELNCVQIDLDAGPSFSGDSSMDEQAAQLCVEVTKATRDQQREDQVALRRDGCYVARLARYQAEPRVIDGPYRLEITERGTLDNLQLRPVTRRAPATGEVEIQVEASGLNFLDVLDVLGILPFERAFLGNECAGEIVRLGENITHLQVGDRVVAMAVGGFSQYVTLSSDLVVRLPASLTFVQAASIPANFSTAYYALHTVANIQLGDKILIHAAAGGTGMAAVQIALAAGAEVYATASPRKWQIVRDMGVEHIYHSRTLDFADQILEDTDGQGVNIVLNSLTGAGFIEKSLSVLAPAGRFLELAKRDVWRADEVASFRCDIHYHLVDLMPIMEQEPARMGFMLTKLMTQFAASIYHPVPQTCFPIQEAVAAFRYMQQAKHIGKIVLTSPITHTPAIQAEATYLITGGLGGLGLAMAQWLAEQGARHLLLVGRSQPKSEAQPQLDSLAKMGVTVTVAQADVTIRSQLRAVLGKVDKRYPLRGVIHSVGVLDDVALLQQSWERFEKVLAPKMQGAWHLHQLTKEMPLDFFVLFSSAASLLGNRGQANHAAANAFLDAFVHYRRTQGLAALSINWGAWSEVGAAAELVKSGHAAARGYGAISPHQGIDAFAHLLGHAPRVPQVGVIPIHWAKFLHHNTTTSPFYQAFKQFARSVTSDSAPQYPKSTLSVDIRRKLAEATESERHALLMQYLRATTAHVLGLDSSLEIDPHQGLVEMGLDSLMAIELRNRVQKELAIELPVVIYLDNRSIVQLVEQIEEMYLISKAALAEGRAVSTPSLASQPVVKPVVRKTTPATKTRKMRVRI